MKTEQTKNKKSEKETLRKKRRKKSEIQLINYLLSVSSNFALIARHVLRTGTFLRTLNRLEDCCFQRLNREPGGQLDRLDGGTPDCSG